ncbi:MAG: signal peptidase I [Actinobacteria bacterium]|nr:signal peptidase I [Actinomycetota bacterium]
MNAPLENQLVESANKKTGDSVGSGVLRTIREYAVLILVALVLSFIIRAAVAEVRVVPTGSMLPTIQIGDRLLTVKILYKFGEPQRGDVVVFEPPEILKGRFSEPFVKRVVGLPGDVIEVRDGKTYVNGEEFRVATADRPRYDYGPRKVPNESYFMLGDNRNQSYDSHEWGFVPRQNIIAKAVLVFWPLDDAKMLK